MATKAKELIKLAEEFAKEKGFKLSKTEKKLLTSVAEGENADYSANNGDNNPEKGDTWDKSRSPNIDIIIWLCTDKEAISYLTHRGIRIIGAKIDGCLDLDCIDLDIPFIFGRCYFTEGITLESAKVKSLEFAGSYIASSKYAIFAQSADIKGFVFLNNGFQAKGEVYFYCATIGGNFEADQSIFENPNGHALIAQSADIKGNVYLTDGFQAKGQVSFYGATIGGNFVCRNSIFNNPQGHALIAQNARIKGCVFLDNGFQSKGEVYFYGAIIGGSFEASQGSFHNPNGHAILAQSAEIKGGVFLDNGFQAKGEVSFYGANIGGNLNCDTGRFYNPKGNAILAQSADIKGSVFLDDSFQAKGQVSFYTATIGGTFFLSQVKNSEEMTLGLESAKINCLSDKEDSWPTKNRLRLEGLVYTSIANRSPVDSQSRLKWIRLQNLKDNFSPQPYEQLAKVLRMSGHEEAAKDILIAKQNDRRLYGELKGFRWGLNCILGLTIDHGYRTQKIFGYFLLFIIVGSLIFCWGESQNLMYPSRIIALINPSPNQKIVDPNYPTFNAFMYSVDTFIPVIDFHQESYWLPNANIKGDVEIPLNYSNTICYENACIGSLLRWYFWFHIAMGWVLTSLAVAGFTGLVRRLG